MSRISLSIDTHVYHALLRFQTKTLADEKDKKKFLDFALRPQEKTGISVLAFVLLDDEAHFLLLLKGGRKAGKNKLQEILKKYDTYFMEEYICPSKRNTPEITYTAIRDPQEMLDICSCIHMLPVERGYVKKQKDYWWSSFQTYRGSYRWEGVDTLPVLQYFTEDAEKSRILFLRYQGKNPKRF